MNIPETLFDWFLSATVRGSLLAVAVLLLQLAFRCRLSAFWRHALWLPVLFVLASPVLPESPWSLESVFTTEPAEVTAATLQTPAPTEEAAFPADTGQFVEASSVSAAPPLDVKSIAAWVWLGGVVTILGNGLTVHARTLRRLRRQSFPVAPALETELAAAAETAGLRRVPRLLMSASIASPAITGIFRPLLLLPADFTDAYHREERQLILLHELIHLRRGDLPVNGLLFFLQALHWCNPVVWLAFARFRADCEAACDCAVLAASPGDARQAYGNVLLNLSNARPHPAWSLGFVGVFGRGTDLRSRVRAIATYRPSHPAWAIPALVLIAMLVVAGGTRAQSNNAPGQTDRLVEVRGRFLHSDGVPASGVQVRIHGWPANENRKIRFGLPKDWKDRDTTTDESGRFTLRFPSHGAFQYSLDAKLSGYAAASWWWESWPRTQVTNIGDVELVYGGQIVGKVVDPKGNPIPVQGQWRVTAKSNYKPAGAAGDTTLVNSRTDPGTGEFRLDDVAPGPVTLTVHSALTGFGKKTVKVEAGETTQTNFVYRGPNPSRRIVLVIWTKPFSTLAFSSIDEQSVLLHGHPAGPKTFQRIPGTSQQWSVEDVPPGNYRVEIKDSKFETWSRSDLTPGHSYGANLKGNAAIQLTVVDAESGAKIDNYRAKVRFGARYHYQIREPGTDLPAEGIYDGLVSTNQTLIVEAPGYAPASVDLVDLRPDETKPVSIKLSASEAREKADTLHPESAPSAPSALETKLKEIVIPELQFKDAEFTDVLSYLRRVSLELDKPGTPDADQGVNFILRANPNDLPSMTLNLRKVSLLDAVKHVASLSGLSYEIEERAVVLKPKPTKQ